LEDEIQNSIKKIKSNLIPRLKGIFQDLPIMLKFSSREMIALGLMLLE